MLCQGPKRVQRDAGSRNRSIDYKDEGVALLLNRLDNRPYSPKVMRTGADRNNDQVGHGERRMGRLRESRRGVDDDHLDAVLTQGFKMERQLRDVHCCE